MASPLPEADAVTPRPSWYLELLKTVGLTGMLLLFFSGFFDGLPGGYVRSPSRAALDAIKALEDKVDQLDTTLDMNRAERIEHSYNSYNQHVAILTLTRIVCLSITRPDVARICSGTPEIDQEKLTTARQRLHGYPSPP